MLNIDKTRSLIKQRGLKVGKVCEMLGYKDTFLADVARGKQSITNENVYKLAQILGTSFEYLTDITDTPDPNLSTKPTPPTEADIKVALFGGDGEVTDEMWDEVKRFAEFVKQNKGKK